MPAGWSGVLPPRNFRGAAIVSAQRPFHATSSLSTLAGSADRYAALPARAGSGGIVFPRVVRNWEGASTRMSPDHCSDGVKSERTFNLEDDWTSLYLGVDRSRRLPTVTIFDMTPKNQAYDAMCQVLRRIAACLKDEATPIMFLHLPMLFLPGAPQVQYLDSLFGQSVASGRFHTWAVDFHNANSPGYRCVTYPQ